ncbi:hypothetical protein HBN67_20575 [Pseudomonas fragi]|uniref:hypothetical protein n=1 Tax=Pseudomonas fragi TaxID=296 RepID=UPI0014737CCD|nr:hypothetical protein [Pseudomonas fragi]NNB60881.1 hypothetical protein [Pseudomonas fragi]
MSQNPHEEKILLNRAQAAVEKRRRQRIVSMAVPGVVGVLAYLANSAFGYDRIIYTFLNLAAIMMIGVSATYAIYNYLQTGFKFSNEDDVAFELEKLSSEDSLVEKNSSLANEVASLKKEFETLKHSQPTMDENSRAEILEMMRARIMEQANSDLAKEHYAKITLEASESLKRRKVDHGFELSRERLLKEIDSLGRRGSLNLGIGGAVTMIGLILLGMTVFYEVSDVKDLLGMASHYLPRLSLIILIEIFAYFFLSLYKAGLSEIKYFQNELTNLEAKQLALQAALETNESAAISSVISKLSETERNHILNKDQTTIELEKAKLESESKVAFGKFVTDFFQKVKPSS